MYGVVLAEVEILAIMGVYGVTARILRCVNLDLNPTCILDFMIEQWN